MCDGSWRSMGIRSATPRSNDISGGPVAAISDDLAEIEVDDTGTIRRDRDRYKRSLREAQDELQTLRERAAFLDAVEQLKPRPPKWVEKPAKGGHKAILVALCSDWHFNEVVSL